MKTKRDIVVIGGSAGAVHAVPLVLSSLPADVIASVLVVIHTSTRSALPEIIKRGCRLPAAHAVDGTKLNTGEVVVAPPGRHLILRDSTVELNCGPRENRHRPAIDPLFRSAALSFGPRVIGVILSGLLDDGSAGLQCIAKAGGLTIVQDPDDAEHPGMPLSAIAALSKPDFVLPIRDIAQKLNECLDSGKKRVPRTKNKPATVQASFSAVTGPEAKPDGEISMFTCPDCGGTLWEKPDGHLFRYACHVGHKFSGESMLQAKGDEVEAALAAALRTLKEREQLLERLASEYGTHRPYTQQSLRERAKEAREQAGRIERLLEMFIAQGIQTSPKPKRRKRP